ncbi:MAG: helix-turn-helix transcriptional regulator [Bacilli bacterium]|nr:helix-turn-helix domain-containing protein [Acholeplasmataceae bacterium]MDY2902750.1 helix-turn-helix transcriptional regulator [Bacilli bacterium]
MYYLNNQKLVQEMAIVTEEINETIYLIKKLKDETCTFSKAFYILKKHYGFRSNAQLANKMNISESTIRNYLLGKNKPDKIETVLAICVGFSLHLAVSKIIMNKTGLTYLDKSLYSQMVIELILNKWYREDIEIINEKLRVLNVKFMIP